MWNYKNISWIFRLMKILIEVLFLLFSACVDAVADTAEYICTQCAGTGGTHEVSQKWMSYCQGKIERRTT